MRIPLTRPYITQEIKDKVCDVLDSGYLTEGAATKELENSFKDYIGCKYALAACNCTVGLEMALRAMGVGSGDEVIVPDYTYPATASVVEIVGARIVLVDVDPQTMLIDYDFLESAITDKTRAVIPVSIFGNPLDYERLTRIKEKYNIFLLEDAACSIGAEFGGTKVGNLADISVFSLHPRKFITTGEGGIVTTNNDKWAEWMDSYKHFGMSGDQSRAGTQFERIGTNYKLSNIQAAVGIVQMKYIEELLSQRQLLANNYIQLLDNHPKIKFQKLSPLGVHSYQSFCVFTSHRDNVITTMREQGIEVQIGTYSLHMHKAYNENANCKISGKMEGSRYAFEHCLALPLYHDLSIDEQEYIVEKLTEIIP
ncbi:MAG: DegT/DnrJ/EryC1/StrS family aminotransferase [Planctomycetota bacterium]|jgi:dTDP-4-amino-4,6-dideoxygalactose transaminase